VYGIGSCLCGNGKRRVYRVYTNTHKISG